MPHLLLVMLGGAIGAGCRYGLGQVASAQFGTDFPWGTLIINLLGGFLAGALLGALLDSGERGETLRLFLGVGFLGGFTTFSAFSAETTDMLQRGQLGMAAAYSLLSVVGAVMMFFAGHLAGRAAS